MPEPQHRPPLTLDDASEYANLSTRFLRREVQRGRLAVVRPGRMLRFRAEDLDRYIEAHRIGVHEDAPADQRVAWAGRGV
jgi:excisionase family DNA binding protein